MSTQSDNIAELATALAKCQGEMGPAIKDSVNPHFKSKFATLYSIWEACREPLSKNGLSIVQTMVYLNEKLCLTTKLLHSSGQWISSTTPVISAKQDAQGIGSALTYFKRYSLSALLGICTADEDDDAEASMPKDRNGNKQKPEKVDFPAISAEECKKITELAEGCHPEYISKITTYLASQGVKTYADIKVDMYNKILNGMIKNAEITARG